jgi:CRP/FNR family cyclic AMP-dependent transcriptional regulator
MLDVIAGSSQSLRRCELFEPLSDAQIEELAARSRRRAIVAGETLLSQNEEARELFVVEHGLLTVRLAVAGGRVVSSAEAGPGQLVGWSALAAPHAYFAEVVAFTDGVVVALSATDVEEVLLQEPAAGYAMMKRIAGLISMRLRDLKEQFVEALTTQS